MSDHGSWLAVGLLTIAACGSDTTKPDPGAAPDLIRACVRRAACGYQPYPRLADCAQNCCSAVEADIVACVDRATTCAAVGSCFGDQGECDNSFQASCDGSTAVTCDLIDHRIYAYRCGDLAMSCSIDSSYKWAASCSGSTTPEPVQRELDCSGGLCVKTGQSCAESGSPTDRCAGDQLESCLDGEWVRFDCASLGLGPCRTTGATPATSWARCGIST